MEDNNWEQNSHPEQNIQYLENENTAQAVGAVLFAALATLTLASIAGVLTTGIAVAALVAARAAGYGTAASTSLLVVDGLLVGVVAHVRAVPSGPADVAELVPTSACHVITSLCFLYYILTL